MSRFPFITRPASRLRPRRSVSSQRGYLLVESLVYIAVLGTLLGVGYTTAYRCFQNSANLRRNADQIAKAVQVGERWRADIRNASPELHIDQNGTDQIVQLAGPQRRVAWLFADQQIFRRIDDQPWVPLLSRVKASTMHADVGQVVPSCRWELELQPHGKTARVRPLFTFMANSPSPAKP